jgi:signal transduction histidine kinase
MGEQIGSIEVSTPPGRELRNFERNLLQDVAEQAGVAFRNALLEAELAGRVRDVETQSVELAASRRRLLGVEDEARERLSAAISRGVMPHLAAVERALDESSPVGPDRGDTGMMLERLIGETERALEELRTVCRGVFPALLERRGLIPALSAQLDAAHPLAVLQVDDSADQRLDRAAEAAAYQFCIDVTPTDRRSVIVLRVDDDRLVVTVSAQGSWAAPESSSARDGSDAWLHARDRVAALDGEVRVRRTESGDVDAVALIPLWDRTASAQPSAMAGRVSA